ncbi:hypothetical protein [Acinetobacter haemolyticus]|uniref:Phage coat protein n=1 Tax=Acinetobacter haemolyticus TaxID=29430 RepID=A0AAW4J318_ACIHA|nr:hypothetical protein [Acinetobacter haemolyticus]MBO3656709.1 hypothetical protein [Acinetobacter haemolyticus]
MTLKNVEVLEKPTQDKTWFQKFRSKRAVTTAVALTGASVAIPAHAEVPDFLAPAVDALGGIGTSLAALFVVAIGITLVIIAFTNSRGGIRKAG